MLSRKRWLAIATAGITTAALAVGSASANPGNTNGSGNNKGDDTVVSAYFADWDVYGRGYEVADIPADNLNTILYAFGKPALGADASAPVGCAPVDPWADYERTPARDVNPAMTIPRLSGNYAQLLELKAQQAAKGKDLKVLISVGGWSLSNGFSQAAATAAGRSAFVASCIDTFIKGNLAPDWIVGDGVGAAAGVFDGIDIDWEYPTAAGAGNVHSDADRHNATLLFQEFRRQLDAIGQTAGKHYLLTAALPAAKNSANYYELKPVSEILDYINVMTYDFHGSWDPYTDFDSPFTFDPKSPNPGLDPTWSVTGTIDYYLSQGVALSKLNVGVPYYAKQYIRTGTANKGLYQPFNNAGLSADTLQWDATPTPTYHDLVDIAGIITADGDLTAAGAAAGWTVNWNHVTREPFLYNPNATHALAGGTITAPTFITYEDPKSVADRTRYVRTLGLRGAYAWEISQDSTSGALSGALAKGLLQH
ncbi:MAG: hypothetical protein JWM93_1345 [Frankiales bacterium]|nr:hypothetical protein [Frankiales bacterium]